MTKEPDAQPGREAHAGADLADPAIRRQWLAAARSQVEDLIFAAEDATAPVDARELGRRGARRLVDEAGDALRRLLDTAGAPDVALADRSVVERWRGPVAPPGKPVTPPLTQEERDVDAAMLAFETDPTPEHEATLRETLRASGRSLEHIDRTIVELKPDQK